MSCLLPSEVKIIPVSGNSNFTVHPSFPKFKCSWLATWYVPASSSWERQSRAEMGRRRRRRWKSVGLLSSLRLRNPEAEDERKREWRRWWSRAPCEVKPEMSQGKKMLWWDDVFEIQNRNHSLIHSSYINKVLHTEQRILQPWSIASWYVSIISHAWKSRLQLNFLFHSSAHTVANTELVHQWAAILEVPSSTDVNSCKCSSMLSERTRRGSVYFIHPSHWLSVSACFSDGEVPWAETACGRSSRLKCMMESTVLLPHLCTSVWFLSLFRLYLYRILLTCSVVYYIVFVLHSCTYLCINKWSIVIYCPIKHSNNTRHQYTH